MAVEPRRILRRGVATLILGVATYYAVWAGEYSTFDLRRIAERTRAESEQLVATRAEVDSLTALIGRLENDPATIEREARERFGMIRPGEVLYRFVEVDSSAAPTAGS
jgi:cell division protein FtsB